MSTETASSTSKAPKAPPHGAPCWIELFSTDPPKLKEFYAAIFPAWDFSKPETYKDSDMEIFHFQEPKAMGGCIAKVSSDAPRPHQQDNVGTTVYYYVKSLEDTKKMVLELGGKTVKERTPEGNHGWYVLFKDPEGNRFGAYEYDWENCKMHEAD